MEVSMYKFGKTFVIKEHNAWSYSGKIADWIRKKVQDAGREGIVLGMSGGIDSAVVGALCARANIPVHAVLLPYGERMTNTGSGKRAMEMVAKFGFSHEIFDIKPAADAVYDTLVGDVTKSDALAIMNVQARIRMTRLYYVAQRMHRFVGGTDNLAENIVGYFTKWGDGANDLQPLSMLTKREVRILARELGVPQSIIDAAPSAELEDGQTDEQELGITYDQLDDFVLNHTSGSAEIDAEIERRYALTAHKRDPIPVFTGE